MIHKLKTWEGSFQAIKTGKKCFDLRKNDRDFKEGDMLLLQEYDWKTKKYTGDEIPARITYITPSDNPFLNLQDFIIMSIEI